jgi:hypothetical protein
MTFSGFDFLFKILPLKVHWNGGWSKYGSVFHLIRETLSEAIKRKLSNGDYKMEKIRGHVGNLTWMCGSNDVYILEFFQFVSQHSHLKYWNWNECNIKIHENNLQMSCLQI